MLSRRVFGLACAVAVFLCLVAAPVLCWFDERAARQRYPSL